MNARLNKYVALMLLLLLSAAANADMNYFVRVNRPGKSFQISMEITNPGLEARIRIPSWCPGFYFLLDYPQRISALRAFDSDGVPIRTTKAGNEVISIANPKGQKLRVIYTVAGTDSGLGFFRSHVRDTSAFINGPAAFMYAEGHMLEKHSVSFELAPGWDVATAMSPAPNGVFIADGYDEFIDHPIQLGRFERRAFTAGGYPFEAIWVADPGAVCDLNAETERLRKGSLPAIQMFGSAPFKKYFYIIHLEIGDFGGGLEHRSSTVIAVANTKSVHLDTLATHEYFHTWNVKNIRPDVLGPFDYTKQVRTGNLWWSEGVTDYYAKIHVYQAGLASVSQLLQLLESDIEDVERSQTAKKLTVEDASRQCWENGGFGVGDLSYYSKGSVNGFLLDAELRHLSSGEKTLDDAMRTLMKEHALPKPGFSENGIRELLTTMVGPTIQKSYDRSVRSTDKLDYSVLTGLGLRLKVPNKSYENLPVSLAADGKISAVSTTADPNSLKVGDLIVSAEKLSDTHATVNVLRKSEKLSVKVRLTSVMAGDFRLEFDPFATLNALARRAEWLKIPAAKG